MWSLRWSPDGRFIAGLSASGEMALYDSKTHKQSEISGATNGYLGWSGDGESLFYAAIGGDASWCKVRMRDRKTKRVAALKNIGVTLWFAPAPNNSPIAARNAGTDEI